MAQHAANHDLDNFNESSSDQHAQGAERESP